MSARLVVTIEVEGVDPILVDPIEYAETILDVRLESIDLIDAEWTLLS